MIKTAAIRQRFSAALEAAGFRRSSFHFDEFPGKDGGSIRHKSFAIGTPTTLTVPGDNRKNATRAQFGVQVVTTIQVRHAYLIRAMDREGDIDAATDAEAAVVAAVESMDREFTSPIWRGITERDFDEEQMLHVSTQEWAVFHPYPVS